MPFQMLVSDIGYSDFLGRLAVGKIANGSLKKNEPLVCIQQDGQVNMKVTKIQIYDGLGMKETNSAEAGEIAIISGTEGVEIGDTICLKSSPKALERIQVDPPTIAMKVAPNTSPLSGREGKYVQSTKIQERLKKETLNNVSIQFEQIPNSESFLLKGRGEFQIAVLVETMRREGFELSLGRPEVIFKEIEGEIQEPMEEVLIDVEQAYVGAITEKLAQRNGKMESMENDDAGRTRIQFKIPSRGLIGYRNEFMTDTRGTGILNSIFIGYDKKLGDIPSRTTGSLIADRTGKAVPYALFNLEPRGKLFIHPGDSVYEGMVIGEHNRGSDLNVNASKEKKLSNVRASGKDDAVVLSPVQKMSLEKAIEFIQDDELVEVTPENIRIRKTVLPANQRS